MSEERSFPLIWPEGFPRAERPRHYKFFSATVHKISNAIRHILGVWKAEEVVISANVIIKEKDGEAYWQKLNPSDAGVAVYFQRNGLQWVVPCDEYDTIADNMQAIRYILDNLQELEAYGSRLAFQLATANFKVLPEKKREATCWDILKIKPGATDIEIRTAYHDELLSRQRLGNIPQEHFNYLLLAREECMATLNQS